MNIWIYIGDRNEIVAVNTNDMNGNSDWVETTDALLLQNIDVGIDTLINNMTTSDGVARYMLIDGSAVERSQSDIEADVLANTQPSATDPVEVLSERVTTVEDTTDEITLLLADVIGGAI